MQKIRWGLLISGVVLAVSRAACTLAPAPASLPVGVSRKPGTHSTPPTTPTARLLADAHAQTHRTRLYDPAYVTLRYPGGDVPPDRGVCTDVVIRALRAGGVDLQKEVHEDMRRNFAAYPHKWGLRRPDPNIDQRRVPNLRTFFTRRGKSLPVTTSTTDYRPGDIVTWQLTSGLDHTGIVSDDLAASPDHCSVIHNIGRGTREEDVLFAWKITGHYRYFR